LADISPSIETISTSIESTDAQLSSDELLKPHQYAVVLEIDALNTGKWTSVRFEYLPRLNIIVVHTGKCESEVHSCAV